MGTITVNWLYYPTWIGAGSEGNGVYIFSPLLKNMVFLRSGNRRQREFSSSKPFPEGLHRSIFIDLYINFSERYLIIER